MNDIAVSVYSNVKIHNVFIKNYKHYLLEIEKFKHYNGKNIKIPIYNFQVIFDYDFCKKNIHEIYNTLTNNSTNNIHINTQYILTHTLIYIEII